MNIVITGAGKGIGLALVRRFLQSPDHNIWACSRHVEALETIASPRLFIATLDIATASASEISEQISRHFNSVDILIHNAGVLINKPFETYGA